MAIRWLCVLSVAVFCVSVALAATAEEVAGEMQRPEDLGRVEVTLMVGGKPLANQGIEIRPDLYFEEILPEGKRADTNADGRCVFEDLPPGPYTVGWMKPSVLRAASGMTRIWTTSHDVGFTLAPGETKVVQIGGVGRPVVGRLAPPPGSEVQFGFQANSTRRMALDFERPEPPEGLSREEAMVWHEEYARSEEGLARRQAFSSYFGDIDADGVFCFEDVPPGRYNIFFRHQFTRAS